MALTYSVEREAAVRVCCGRVLAVARISSCGLRVAWEGVLAVGDLRDRSIRKKLHLAFPAVEHLIYRPERLQGVVKAHVIALTSAGTHYRVRVVQRRLCRV